jgi:hypothetical protein
MLAPPLRATQRWRRGRATQASRGRTGTDRQAAGVDRSGRSQPSTVAVGIDTADRRESRVLWDPLLCRMLRTSSAAAVAPVPPGLKSAPAQFPVNRGIHQLHGWLGSGKEALEGVSALRYKHRSAVGRSHAEPLALMNPRSLTPGVDQIQG